MNDFSGGRDGDGVRCSGVTGRSRGSAGEHSSASSSSAQSSSPSTTASISAEASIPSFPSSIFVLVSLVSSRSADTRIGKSIGLGGFVRLVGARGPRRASGATGRAPEEPLRGTEPS